MGVGDRIKKQREKMGLTQMELADRLGINNSVLSRIEAGKRGVDDNELLLFADFFDVDSDYLLGRTNKLRHEINMSFFGGPDQYTPDEIEEMEAALIRYRKMKERAREEAARETKKKTD
ncbi:helix-turn-helix domain-containing protein [Paenibacillus melissococcoides]|uniref:Helix-turn-helix domain-containing protein n=1 Tax=Paenibacillus melissococcoides TaxID=2912268 RepID=A0ABN8UEG4_9BACL|nr:MULTISPECIES: helix-turn-helix transcriptional regulator [Paenibacillus]MEB9896791.1 helix-turn-helix transcriptional regulator [Bacillus cereus]CAH8248591.1 helix-turn-helix domain-containing protein [Paenibacillus melissococcoides]CAH8714312.1 helix-turn-helix domain-containing protein [Paenibacillus melissococcoides]CAH8719922.1 helix-turn-helix domain-containing protein [Paenibacillus melissococcoides]GIO79580.1 transcriptional regulator [Paenibacillus dendritiformis]